MYLAGTSLVVLWLRLFSQGQDPGVNPWSGNYRLLTATKSPQSSTKIPRATAQTWHSKKKKKKDIWHWTGSLYCLHLICENGWNKVKNGSHEAKVICKVLAIKFSLNILGNSCPDDDNVLYPSKPKAQPSFKSCASSPSLPPHNSYSTGWPSA